MFDNRLYEGAKTLVDMLDIIRMTRAKFILNEVGVEISNDISFPHAMITSMIRIFDGDNNPHGPITIRMIYTNAGQKTHYGAFITSIQSNRGDTIPLRSGIGDTVIRDFFGNIPALEKYVDLDKPFCYKAGQSLRYSENLPTPSEYVNEIDLCISDACEYLKQKPEEKEDNNA